MLDADFIRQNADKVKENCRNRANTPEAAERMQIAVDRVVAFETRRKELAQRRSETAACKNQVSGGFKNAKTDEEKKAIREQAATLDKEVGVIDADLKLIEGDLLFNLILHGGMIAVVALALFAVLPGWSAVFSASLGIALGVVDSTSKLASLQTVNVVAP